MTIGKFYKVTYEVTETYVTYLNIQYPNTSLNSSLGTHTVYIKATNVNIGFAKSSVGKITIDNVSVKEVGQNWTFGTGWSIEDGVVSANEPTGNLDQSLTATSGSKYRVTFTISNYVSGDIRWRFTGTSNENGTLRSANGTYTEEITLTNNQAIFRFPGTSGVMDIDNISVVEVTDDTDLPRINYTNFDYQDVLGDELVTNGSFDTDSDWSKSASATISSGVVTFTASSSNVYIYQVLWSPNAFTNKTVKVTYTITSNTLDAGVFIINGLGSNDFSLDVIAPQTVGTHSVYIPVLDRAGNDNRFAFLLNSQATSGAISIDNVSVKEITYDVVVPYSGEGSLLL